MQPAEAADGEGMALNRYQQEVAAMDRHREILVRALSFAGASVLIVAALWSAGLPPNVWFERVLQWVAGSDKEVLNEPVTAIPDSIPPMMLPAAPVALPSEALAGTDSSLSVTPQPLVLISTAPGRNAREGTAALGVDPSNPQTYGAGALLANGAQLAEIHEEYVVLERDGRSSRLYRRDNRAGRQSHRDNELTQVGGDQGTTASDPTMREVLTDYVRPSPVYDGEVLRGYEVHPGARSGVFAQLGLQAGDVIVAIDGMPLNDPISAFEIFRQLTEGVAMTATLQRKGSRERMALDGSLIVADQERTATAAAVPPEAMAGPPPL